GGEIDGGVRVRVAAVPSGDGGVVVQHVPAVPPEDDVAESQATFGDAPELVEGHVLAAQDAVDVEPAELHLADAVIAELLAQMLDLRFARFRGVHGRGAWG